MLSMAAAQGRRVAVRCGGPSAPRQSILRRRKRSRRSRPKGRRRLWPRCWRRRWGRRGRCRGRRWGEGSSCPPCRQGPSSRRSGSHRVGPGWDQGRRKCRGCRRQRLPVDAEVIAKGKGGVERVSEREVDEEEQGGAGVGWSCTAPHLVEGAPALAVRRGQREAGVAQAGDELDLVAVGRGKGDTVSGLVWIKKGGNCGRGSDGFFCNAGREKDTQ